MLSSFKARAQKRKPDILAIETAVVDLQYPKDGGGDALKHEFFAHLKELITADGNTALFDENPRGGDMCLVPAEEFDAALILFAQRHNIQFPFPISPTATPADRAFVIRDYIFGTPVSVAGGSLANTFHALVSSQLDGQQLVQGHFVTSIGVEDSANAFHDSMNGHIYCRRMGRQMECHVFPIDGDRILIATPGRADPAESHIDIALFEDALRWRKAHCPPAVETRIMLGGFLFFTPGFRGVCDAVIAHIQGRPANDRPSLMLTASAQAVSAHPDFRAMVAKAAHVTDTTIHANTGEFRRLLDMDTDWRKPFDVDFTGLRGQALETAKSAHIAYRAAKDAANVAAISAAFNQAAALKAAKEHTLRYVVTDGARSIHVIGPQGHEIFAPHKIEKAQIVNTVGAGDNFAAGFQLADLYGLPHADCASLASDFAAAVIQVPAARLDGDRVVRVQESGIDYETRGALSHIGQKAKSPQQP